MLFGVKKLINKIALAQLSNPASFIPFGQRITKFIGYLGNYDRYEINQYYGIMSFFYNFVMDIFGI